MKRWNKISTFLIICLVLSACSPQRKTDFFDTVYDYEEIADTMCDCSKELFKIYDKIKSLPKEEKIQRKKELKMKMGESSQRAKICLETYLDKNKIDKAVVSREYFDMALKQKCPKLYFVMKIGRFD